MVKKSMQKTIVIDGKELASGFPNSKNVMKIIDADAVMIYITPDVKTFIRTSDVDKLILDLSWGCDYNESECEVYDWESKLVIGKGIRKETRYVSATLSAKNEEDAKDKVEKYKLEPTLPIVKNFLNGKKMKIYLHRYIKGMYSIDGVKVIRERFGISDEKFNVKGLSQLQVHHMDGNPLENYSDKLIIVKPEKHYLLKRKDPNAYNLYSGQLSTWNNHGTACMELKNFESGMTKGFIIDLDDAGTNIDFLKNYMTSEIKYSRDFMLMSTDITEAFGRLPSCNKQVQLKYEYMSEKMKSEGKIKIIEC